MLKKKIKPSKLKIKKVSVKSKKEVKEIKVSKTQRKKVIKPCKVKKEKAKIIKEKPSVSEVILEEKRTEVIPSEENVSSVTTQAQIKEKPSQEEIVTAAVIEGEKPAERPKVLELEFPISLRDLAVKLQQKPSVLIKRLMDKGILVGINQNLNEDVVEELARDFGFQIQKAKDKEEELLEIHRLPDDPHKLKQRPPVVTFMGHVDHGKTSLLDAIRKTKVAESEYGGITQHIGAYQISIKTKLHPDKEESITFLDTPGHEAFTRMRARGARITDIVVLVVAADEGVMPQTIEAIDHSREAGVPIMVAINKIDKPNIDIERVKKQLADLGLVPEEWQGNTVMVGVSAKTGQGIDELLELILLQAEMMDLKANYEKLAKGVVIESQISSEKGIMATLLVQNGTLKLNDNLVIGIHYGKVRAMFDEHGRRLSQAFPSTPVKILGLNGLPEAGDEFFVVPLEEQAKEISSLRMEKKKQQQLKPVKKINLEELSLKIKEGKIKEFKVILKVDTAGSLEAIKEVLEKIKTPQISINIIHSGIGDINTSDVLLASASNAIILGFNVGYEVKAKELLLEEGVEAKVYNVIYELSNELKSVLEGMLEPKTKKVFLGRAEIRKVFKLSKAGTVAGCFVSKGRILRNANISLIRNGKVIYEGKIFSLKRFKDDVREVTEGMECGISLGEFSDIFEGDIIEAYEIQKIAPKIT
jgi:translation initiation factor IF-2